MYLGNKFLSDKILYTDKHFYCIKVMMVNIKPSFTDVLTLMKHFMGTTVRFTN